MLGHEDVMAKREYTTTVVCKSSYASLYVCNADAFHNLLSKDEKALKTIVGMCE